MLGMTGDETAWVLIIMAAIAGLTISSAVASICGRMRLSHLLKDEKKRQQENEEGHQ